jgi:bifunctional DNA-binding transcriptional regulator/antitoxin component of YhaV-PrlF toxin-antitoxin module
MSNKTYESRVLEILDNGDAVIEIPQEVMDEMGWKVGDVLDCFVEEDKLIIRKFPIAPNNY